MQRLTHAQVVDLLASVKLPTPIGLTTLTDTNARKTGNPFAQVLKLSRVWPFTGTVYANAVNAQLAREGSETGFIPASPRYERISPALVRFTNGRYGVPVQFNSTLRQASAPLYFARRDLTAPLQYVTKATVAPFLPGHTPEGHKLDVSGIGRQAAAGVQNPIVWRTYGVESLLRVTLGGETYKVRE